MRHSEDLKFVSVVISKSYPYKCLERVSYGAKQFGIFGS